MMEISKKQLLLTTDDLTILSELLEHTSHLTLFKQINNLKLKDDKLVYRVNKEFFEEMIFNVDMCQYDDLLLKTPTIRKIKMVRDSSKTQFEGLDGSYFVRIDKSNAFIHKWEAQLYSYENMVKELEKKTKSLKSEKSKEPYLTRANFFQKKINFIHSHPERLV